MLVRHLFHTLGQQGVCVCVYVVPLLSYALPLLSLHATALIKYLPPILWRGRILNCFWYYDDRRPRFSRGGLYSSFLFFLPPSLFLTPIRQTRGERVRVEGWWLFCQSVLCLISVPYTHTHRVSLFLFISIQRVSSPTHPPSTLNTQWKLRGHWFLLIFIMRCTQAEREREEAREESFSSLLSSFFSLRERCCPCQGGGRQERRKWLPFSLQLEPIVCSSHYLSLLLPLCVLTNLKQKNTLVHVLLDANSVVSRLKFFFHSL